MEFGLHLLADGDQLLTRVYSSWTPDSQLPRAVEFKSETASLRADAVPHSNTPPKLRTEPIINDACREQTVEDLRNPLRV